MSHEVSKISHPESPMKKKVKPKNELSLFPYMVLKYKEEGAVEEAPEETNKIQPFLKMKM